MITVLGGEEALLNFFFLMHCFDKTWYPALVFQLLSTESATVLILETESLPAH